MRRLSVDECRCGNVDNPDRLEAIDKTTGERLRHIQETLDFVTQCNTPGEFMSDDKLEKLQQIAKLNYPDSDGPKPYVEEDEVHNLSIRKGTLTREEFRVIQDHVVLTRKMLEQVPFPKHLKNVPLYASQHHEKINGSGYPEGLKGEAIPIQSRILAIADIYEAVTSERPYRRPFPMEEAIRIMRHEKGRKLDPELVDMFFELVKDGGRTHMYAFGEEGGRNRPKDPPRPAAPVGVGERIQ